MNAVAGIMIGNTIFSLLFFCYHFKNKNIRYCAFFFLLFPLMGLLLFISYYFSMFLLKNQKTDWTYLNHRYQFEKNEDIPNVHKELDIIPVKDAMAISRNSEKRTLILEQLKKGIGNHYKNVMAAEGDSDSESAHYVASAKMEVYRELKEKLKQAIQEYEFHQVNGFPVMEESLAGFIESGLLAKNEKRNSMVKYVSLIKETKKEQAFPLNKQILERFLIYALELLDYEGMKEFWESEPDEEKTEMSYLRMMEMYYEIQDKENFYKILDEMCTSKNVLSAEGIRAVRFWAKGRD